MSSSWCRRWEPRKISWDVIWRRGEGDGQVAAVQGAVCVDRAVRAKSQRCLCGTVRACVQGAPHQGFHALTWSSWQLNLLCFVSEVWSESRTCTGTVLPLWSLTFSFPQPFLLLSLQACGASGSHGRPLFLSGCYFWKKPGYRHRRVRAKCGHQAVFWVWPWWQLAPPGLTKAFGIIVVGKRSYIT